MKLTQMIRKWDIALIAILLLLSCVPTAIFWASGQSTAEAGTHAIIYVNGREYKTIPLSEHHGTDSFTIRTEAGYNTVLIRDDEIAIIDADCPDQICVQEGFLKKPGQTSVCLPHKVMVEVQANDTSDPDIVRAR